MVRAPSKAPGASLKPVDRVAGTCLNADAASIAEIVGKDNVFGTARHLHGETIFDTLGAGGIHRDKDRFTGTGINAGVAGIAL
jgi:hypothetical protein